MSKRRSSVRETTVVENKDDFDIKEGVVLDNESESDQDEEDQQADDSSSEEENLWNYENIIDNELINEVEDEHQFEDENGNQSDDEDENQSEDEDGNQSDDEDENQSEEEDRNQSVDEDKNQSVDDENDSEDENGNLSADEDRNESIDKDRLKSWEEAEYTDTSDEEELRNTVGNIPLEWYNEYSHIGYDLDGQKIVKPLKGDQLDEFLRKMDDPNYWRTVIDKTTGKEIILTDEDVDLIERIQSSQYPTEQDQYTPYEDVYSHEKMIHPMTNRPEPKRRFLPSLWERKKITRMVKAIKSGSLKPISKPPKPRFYMLWGDSTDNEKIRPHQFIPAPKVRPPSHAESYNPPPEFLPTDEQREKRKPKSFIPTKYSSLRLVPAYHSFLKERFERCLDLYLCPRQTRMRIRVDPESLIPKLPRPRDLQPFPTTESIVYEGHTSFVRSIDVDKEGVWLASVSDDNSMRLWEVSTGRCVKTVPINGKATCLQFCPNDALSLIALSVESSVIIINHGLGDRLVVSATDSTLSSFDCDEYEGIVKWETCNDTTNNGYRLILNHTKKVQQVTWHHKGDYFSAVINEGGVSVVYIHQLSKRRSQNPFKSLKGLVQKVTFHPSRPFFFVATQTYVRVYNLLKQELSKKLSTGVKWISSIAVHPKGDNLIIGSYDKRLCWFDMDLSTKPYKILRHHRQAIRQVCYHPTYPLFASASDDGTVIICHGMVYNDLMQNPLIVPVKVLRAIGSSVDSFGIMDCVFHPNQPWIFTAGADGLVKMYS